MLFTFGDAIQESDGSVQWITTRPSPPLAERKLDEFPLPPKPTPIAGSLALANASE